MGTTQNTTAPSALVAELTAAIDRFDNCKGTGRVVALMDDASYDLATRISENLNAVGLTGLCEDIKRGDADRSELRDVLVVALAEARLLD
jgi:hypothetical protein